MVKVLYTALQAWGIWIHQQNHSPICATIMATTRATTLSVTSTTREYYDSSPADDFYHTSWGGQSICIGTYDSPDDSIAEASQRTVERMAARAAPITRQTRVIDMGSGYGGSARYLAKTYGCRVTCLNLSPVQNQRNKLKCREQDLEHLIDIIEASFEDIPLPDHSFDLVWSQDSFTHSSNREKVVGEIDRVLVKRGGRVVFTDPMEKDGVDRAALTAVMKRLPVDHFGTVNFYLNEFVNREFTNPGFEDWTGHMTRHYAKVLEELEGLESSEATSGRQPPPGLAAHGKGQAAFIANMKVGLRAWIAGSESGDLVWGCFSFIR